jgi:uncharacterized protein (DUF1330 family)
MSAYIVFTREHVRNQDELKEYSQKAGPAMKGYPLTVLAAYGRHEVIEGPAVEGVVILQFPTFEEAKAWYESPAYQEACKHRFAGADYRAIIVQGV